MRTTAAVSASTDVRRAEDAGLLTYATAARLLEVPISRVKQAGS